MKRKLFYITIIYISIIMGLQQLNVCPLFYLLKQNKVSEKELETKKDFIITIISEAEKKDYCDKYLCKYKNQKFIVYIKAKNKKSKKELEENKFKKEKSQNNKVKEYEIGDILHIKAEYKKGSKARNYKGFDYNMYLKSKQIRGVFNAEENIKLIAKSKNIFILKKKLYSKLRNKIKRNYKSNLSKEDYALISGLTIGDKSNMKKSQIESFKDASLSHVLTISGVHFAYIILALECISKLIKNRNFGIIIKILGIIFFVNLTGASPSVVRVGLMTIILYTAKLINRQYDIINAISLSILIQMFINPYVIYDMSFILSYMGVISILMFYKIMKKFISLDFVAVTLSANLVMLPYMALKFHYVNIAAVLSNILPTILLGPIIILGYISNIFRFKIIYKILSFLLFLLNKNAEIFSNIEIFKCYIKEPSTLSVIIIYALIIYIYIKYNEKEYRAKLEKLKTANSLKDIKQVEKVNKIEALKQIKINSNKNIKIIAILLIIIIISNLNYEILDSKINKKLLINFIDVGQGDCCLIREGNKTVMIDAGGSLNPSNYDVGKSVNINYLLAKKIKTIDYIIISHFDADHVQGFIYLLKNLNINNIIIAKQGKTSQHYKEVLSIAKDKKIKVRYVKSGDCLRLNRAKIEILFPTYKLINENVLNNNSIVCKLEYCGFKILFTGDIEKIAEEQLLKMNIDLSADVLKVAHHGSKSSSIEAFLDSVNPKVAIISAGVENKFNHPNKITAKKLKARKIKIYRTDLNGEIFFNINNKGKMSKVKTRLKEREVYYEDKRSNGRTRNTTKHREYC